MNVLLSKINISKSGSLLSCALIVAALQGCGGGGGGGGGDSAGGTTNPPSSSPSPTPTAPEAPTLALAFTGIKQLKLDWNAATGATYYKLLESTNGGSTFSQIGGDLTAISVTRDIAIHMQNWSNTRYQVQACNSAGCTASNTPSAGTAVLNAIGYFKASNTGSGDTYGWAMALSGDGRTLAVGAPGEDSAAKNVGGNQSDNSQADSGAVYVYTLANNSWTQQAYIKASNTFAAARFGTAVTLSHNGNTLAIGAPFEDSAATAINGNENDHSASGAGAAYVFERSGGTWANQAYVKASNNVADLYFGWSLSLSDDGNWLAAGAPGAANEAGTAYLFSRSSGSSSWSERAQVTASNANAEDSFGVALALSGNATTLAVGAPYEASAGGNQADNSAAKSGAVYVFTGSGSSWAQQAYIKASNADIDDNFGAAVALSDTGDTLAVGAPYEQSNATGVGGDPANDSADDAGAAYVFKRTGSSWAQQAYIKASNTNVNDDFGMTLALSSDGNALVVGAIGESANSIGIDGAQNDNSKDGVGAAYLFGRTGSAWSQQHYIKPRTANLGTEFGSAIGLSADATTLAISGAFERSSATGIGGDQSITTSADAGALWLF